MSFINIWFDVTDVSVCVCVFVCSVHVLGGCPVCGFKQGAPTCTGISAQAQLSRAQARETEENRPEAGLHLSHTPRPAAGHNTAH